MNAQLQAANAKYTVALDASKTARNGMKDVLDDVNKANVSMDVGRILFFLWDLLTELSS